MSNKLVYIARCPEHGLHGERTECFVCGGPVERVAMTPAPNGLEALIRTDQTRRIVEALRAYADGEDGGALPTSLWLAADYIERLTKEGRL